MIRSKTRQTHYRGYAVILVLLLFLTAISVTATWLNAGSLGVVVALGIATIKAAVVLLYFMHLKFDELIFKIFTGMVFFLLTVVFTITFFDYWFR